MSAGRCFFHTPWKVGLDRVKFEGSAASAIDAWQPATDVVETEDGWVIQMETPGVSPEDISIHLEGSRLIIRGVRRPPTLVKCRRYRHLEIRHGVFQRELPLPGPVAETAAYARLCGGILEIVLPRGEASEFALWAIRFQSL